MSTPCRSVNWSLNTQRTPKATKAVFSLPLELACSPSVRCKITPLILKEFVHGIRTLRRYVQIPWWFGAVVKDGGGKIGKVFEITITLPFFHLETSNRNFLSTGKGNRVPISQKLLILACGKRLVKTQCPLSRHSPFLPPSHTLFFFTIQESDFYTHGDDATSSGLYLGELESVRGGTRASLCAIEKQRKGRGVTVVEHQHLN